MASPLHIKGIRKAFGKGDKAVEVLKRIDIDVAPGEFLILVGPSGCGKSTLLNIIAGLEEPTEGELHIGGKNVIGMPPAQRDIAMVFQSYALYPTMTVADNIGFALEMRKVPKADRDKRIQEVAGMLQILEGWDLKSMDEAHRTHLVVEAMRRAYRDRGLLGDPDEKRLQIAIWIVHGGRYPALSRLGLASICHCAMP